MSGLSITRHMRCSPLETRTAMGAVCLSGPRPSAHWRTVPGAPSRSVAGRIARERGRRTWNRCQHALRRAPMTEGWRPPLNHFADTGRLCGATWRHGLLGSACQARCRSNRIQAERRTIRLHEFGNAERGEGLTAEEIRVICQAFAIQQDIL
jgi:hypothetical protein